MSELPSWYPGSEDRPAPMPLLRVQAFLNTLDVEDGTDLLTDPETARAWLADAGLLAKGAELDEADLALARELREGIRSVLEGGHAVETLRRVAAARHARLTVAEDGTVGLENAGAGDFGDGLFELLLTVHRAQEDGSWSRLKVCANPDCRWAFFDRSRNRQGSWCSMDSCGNRLKNRQFRARHR